MYRWPTQPAVDATVTIRPRFARQHPRQHSPVHRNAPVALTSSWDRQSATVVFASGALDDTPALLTSTSTSPSAAEHVRHRGLVGDVAVGAAQRHHPVAEVGEPFRRPPRRCPACRRSPPRAGSRQRPQRAPVELAVRGAGQATSTNRMLMRASCARPAVPGRTPAAPRPARGNRRRPRAAPRTRVAAPGRRPRSPATPHSTHVLVADEAVLDLARRHPDAARLQQVVGAAVVVEEPVGVPAEQVSRVDGVAAVGRRRLLLVPEVLQRDRAAR